MTTATYNSYPIQSVASVPGARQKLSTSTFLLYGGILFAGLVVIIALIAVLNKPTTTLCHFTCGPDVGPRLSAPTYYQNSTFGYRVEYDGNYFKPTASSSGVQLSLTVGGGGFIHYSATSGSDVNGAMQKAFNGLNTNAFQNISEIEPIPGAEIGLVEGQGVAYSASYVPQGGGKSIPVSIAVMASTFNNVTISVVAIDTTDLSSPITFPLGFADGELLDGPLTNTVWAGQQ
jgi:hypothetical protein